MSILDLVAKIEKLPPDKQKVVEDFVDFLLLKVEEAVKKCESNK